MGEDCNVPVPLPQYIQDVADRAAEGAARKTLDAARTLVDNHSRHCPAPVRVRELELRFASLLGYMVGSAAGGAGAVYGLIRLFG